MSRDYSNIVKDLLLKTVCQIENVDSNLSDEIINFISIDIFDLLNLMDPNNKEKFISTMKGEKGKKILIFVGEDNFMCVLDKDLHKKYKTNQYSADMLVCRNHGRLKTNYFANKEHDTVFLNINQKYLIKEVEKESPSLLNRCCIFDLTSFSSLYTNAYIQQQN